jgi:2-aminoadipate transaminase
VGDDELREGVARIGKVVNEQVRLYSTLTGTAPVARREPVAKVPEAEGARIVPLRRRAG